MSATPIVSAETSVEPNALKEESPKMDVSHNAEQEEQKIVLFGLYPFQAVIISSS
jgi:hypothetical protein